MVTGHLGGRHSHQACYVYVLSIVYIIMLWISDGIHLFQGLSFTSSLAILIVAIRGSSRWKYALSLCLLGAGLLIREDTLAVVPVMLLLGYLYSLRNGTKQTYLYVYFGAMVVVCALFMIYRSLVVPELQPLDLKLKGMVNHIFYSFNVMGFTHFNIVTKMLIYGWFVVQMVMAFSIAIFRSRMVWRLQLLWLSCAVLTCLPALSVERVNLLLFPLTFTALLFCSVLEELARLSFFYRLFAITALLWGISGGFYFSYIAQQAFHPYSLSVLKRNGQFVYGILSHATIPQERREMVVKQLAVLGIHTEHDVNTLLPQMASQALADKRYLPSDSVPFIPRLDMFEPELGSP